MESLFFCPQPKVVRALVPSAAARAETVRSLCARAGVDCLASGAWTERKVYLVPVPAGEVLSIVKEPGDWSAVQVGLPGVDINSVAAARGALLVLAYGLMDLVARESIRGVVWARPSAARGRPRTGKAMSNAQRQARYRQRHATTAR